MFCQTEKSTIVYENSTVFALNCSFEPLYVEECHPALKPFFPYLYTPLRAAPSKRTSLRASRVAPHSTHGLFIRKTPSWCISAVVLKIF